MIFKYKQIKARFFYVKFVTLCKWERNAKHTPSIQIEIIQRRRRQAPVIAPTLHLIATPPQSIVSVTFKVVVIVIIKCGVEAVAVEGLLPELNIELLL